MKTAFHPRSAFTMISLAVLLALPARLLAAPPDLTAAGVADTIDRKFSSSR